MGTSTYIELLKDPRWQKRRLDIFNRDGFACTECGDKKKTLHVHHRYYLRGKKPWAYDDDALTTLCEDCHDMVTAITGSLKLQLGRLNAFQLEAVAGFALGVELSGHMFSERQPPKIHVPVTAEAMEFSGLVVGLGLNRADIYDLERRGQLSSEGLIRLAEKRASERARAIIAEGRSAEEGYYEDTLS